MEQVFDIAVIGGGINGCGIAADAALRGLSVLLLEKDDLASKTSSNSSKLIHGGLRYLEHYDFALVKKALDERQILLKIAPHLVYPLPFVLPYEQTMRPVWLLRTGLFLYDHLSRKNKLPKSKFIRRSQDPSYFEPLALEYLKGFKFYDCTTDDARLTIANAIQAHEHGAKIYTHCELHSAKAQDNRWYIETRLASGQGLSFAAKAIVNATGPWVEEINQRLQIPNHYKMSLVKGSHLLVAKCYEGNHAYLLQNTDNRIVFLVPYQDYTMIGTTDVVFNRSLDSIQISPEEIQYLLELANRYLKHPLKQEDILHTWSGVRPLIASGEMKPQSLSRDYAYEYSHLPAPAVSIYGGKITTYRQLSQEAVEALKPTFPSLKGSISSTMILPGGEYDHYHFKNYLEWANNKYRWLEPATRERLLHTYGSRTELILANCHQKTELGLHFGQGLYQAEVDYLIQKEWARTEEDILWRRTKLGLRFSADEQQALTLYMKNRNKD